MLVINSVFYISVQPTPLTPNIPVDPCNPSPCGPFSECRPIGDNPSCSCRPNYIGSPPNCRPECVVNTDCPFTQACISEKCRDPCAGSCGLNADCRVQNHIPTCTCAAGFTGDPFTQCSLIVGECCYLYCHKVTSIQCSRPLKVCWSLDYARKDRLFFLNIFLKND